MFKSVIKKLPGGKRLAQKLGLFSNQAKERMFLLEMLPKHSIGAEIGVHKGSFSQKLLDFTSPKELHLIDPWKHHTSDIYKTAWYGGRAKHGQEEMDERYADVCNRFEQEMHAGIVKIHRGYSAEILEQFPDEYFDWIYIDGNHLYEYVKKDLELSLRKTKLNGLIAGDDYTADGWWEGGVKRAVDEFSTRDACQLIEVRNQQFIFRKT